MTYLEELILEEMSQKSGIYAMAAKRMLSGELNKYSPGELILELGSYRTFSFRYFYLGRNLVELIEEYFLLNGEVFPELELEEELNLN